MSTWLVTLLLAVSQGHSWGWSSPITIGLFAATVVVLPIWVWAESRSDSPLVDMKMMRIPTVWTVNLVALLFGMGMYSMFAFLPQFLQTPDDVTGYGFGASVTESGLLLLPQTVATFLAGLFSGRLAARFGSKAVLVVGAGLTSLATLGLVLFHDEVWQLLVETTFLGLAFGLAFAALSNLIVDAVPQSQTGVASGMNANIRTVGGALGSAVLASVITANARPDGLPLESGYTNGFTVLVVTSALATLVAVLVPVVRARTRAVPTDGACAGAHPRELTGPRRTSSGLVRPVAGGPLTRTPTGGTVRWFPGGRARGEGTSPCAEHSSQSWRQQHSSSRRLRPRSVPARHRRAPVAPASVTPTSRSTATVGTTSSTTASTWPTTRAPTRSVRAPLCAPRH